MNELTYDAFNKKIRAFFHIINTNLHFLYI
jgi:hypothetical protein